MRLLHNHQYSRSSRVLSIRWRICTNIHPRYWCRWRRSDKPKDAEDIRPRPVRNNGHCTWTDIDTCSCLFHRCTFHHFGTGVRDSRRRSPRSRAPEILQKFKMNWREAINFCFAQTKNAEKEKVTGTGQLLNNRKPYPKRAIPGWFPRDVTTQP